MEFLLPCMFIYLSPCRRKEAPRGLETGTGLQPLKSKNSTSMCQCFVMTLFLCHYLHFFVNVSISVSMSVSVYQCGSLTMFLYLTKGQHQLKSKLHFQFHESVILCESLMTVWENHWEWKMKEDLWRDFFFFKDKKTK